MSLNGMDLLQYETIDEIMAVLIEATWPKGFQFRRPRTDVSGSSKPKTSTASKARKVWVLIHIPTRSSLQRK